MPSDPEKQKLQAALEQLEAEKQRRIDLKIEDGDVICVSPVVVGSAEGVETAKAAAISRLRAAGEAREVHFGHPMHDADGREIDRVIAIITGVPRTGRDKLPDDYVPWKPSERYIPPPTPETQRASSPESTWEVRSVGEWHYVRAQVRRPDPEKDDPGEIKEGRYRLEGNLLHVEDSEGRRLSLQPSRPDDDIEAAARKVLREKHGRHGAFYDPIRYPKTFH